VKVRIEKLSVDEIVRRAIEERRKEGKKSLSGGRFKYLDF